jgi:hypothetical protein
MDALTSLITPLSRTTWKSPQHQAETTLRSLTHHLYYSSSSKTPASIKGPSSLNFHVFDIHLACSKCSFKG